MGNRKNTAPATSSSTGFWTVELARPITLGDITYRPGDEHTVDDATLAAMRDQDAEAIDNAAEAA